MATEQLTKGNDDGTIFGQSTTDLIGFYGLATAISQRASSNQVTTNLATSSSFGATQLAVVQEIMNTLAALNLWKGAA
jgi:hypothetical protein